MGDGPVDARHNTTRDSAEWPAGPAAGDATAPVPARPILPAGPQAIDGPVSVNTAMDLEKRIGTEGLRRYEMKVRVLLRVRRLVEKRGDRFRHHAIRTVVREYRRAGWRGVSVQSVYRWFATVAAFGAVGLLDGRCVRLPEQTVDRAIAEAFRVGTLSAIDWLADHLCVDRQTASRLLLDAIKRDEFPRPTCERTFQAWRQELEECS